MENKKNIAGVNRRKFFAGLFAGMGVAGVAMAASKQSGSTTTPIEENPGNTSPVLYKRTPEVERYYKTLYQ